MAVANLYRGKRDVLYYGIGDNIYSRELQRYTKTNQFAYNNALSDIENGILVMTITEQTAFPSQLLYVELWRDQWVILASKDTEVFIIRSSAPYNQIAGLGIIGVQKLPVPHVTPATVASRYTNFPIRVLPPFNQNIYNALIQASKSYESLAQNLAIRDLESGSLIPISRPQPVPSVVSGMISNVRIGNPRTFINFNELGMLAHSGSIANYDVESTTEFAPNSLVRIDTTDGRTVYFVGRYDPTTRTIFQ